MGLWQRPCVELERESAAFDRLTTEGRLGELVKLPISGRIVRPSSVCPTTNGFACLKERCSRFIRAMRTVTKSLGSLPGPVDISMVPMEGRKIE